MKPFRILFVCLGNICRSPMAAALCKKRLAEAKPTRLFEVSSAGFLAGSKPASQPAEAVMLERGLDLSGHLSSQINAQVADQQSLILTMEEEQAREIAHMAPSVRVSSLLAFATQGKEQGDIFDPYGETIVVYRRVATRLESLIDDVVTRLRDEELI